MRNTASPISRFIEKTDLGSWALLLPGLFILFSCLLLPAWLERQNDQETLNATRAELQYTQRELDNHKQLLNAWEEQDPILIQRLAWHQLRMQRDDLNTVNGATPHRAGNTRHWRQWVKPDEVMLTDYEKPQRPADTKITRLIRDYNQRPRLIALGSFLLFVSLVISLRAHFTDSPTRGSRRLKGIFKTDEKTGTAPDAAVSAVSEEETINPEHTDQARQTDITEERETTEFFIDDENIDFSDLTRGDSTMFDPRDLQPPASEKA